MSKTWFSVCILLSCLCAGFAVWCHAMRPMAFDPENARVLDEECKAQNKDSCSELWKTSRRACLSGNAQACMYYASAIFSAQPGRSLRLMAAQCNRGLTEACVRAADINLRGISVTQNYKQAFRFLTAACNYKDYTSCVRLGTLYRLGDGTEQNLGQAAKLYARACEDWGEGEGCRLLGQMYRQGNGVDEDLGKAHNYLRQGCTAGNSDACVELAEDYQNGRGFKQNERQAKKYYKRACELDGNEYACRALEGAAD